MALTSPSINLTEQITVTPNIPLKKMGKQARSVAITGGKGGVGKSNLAVNLAFELGSLDYQVGLLDADLGLANADILCGISPKFHLGHVVTGLKDLEDTIIKLSDNVSLIPGGSGIEELAKFSFSAHPHILAKLLMMEENLDFMLIDTAAGIAENVISILVSAAQVIIVATPEPTSIVDAYATIKVILRHSPKKPISIVVNNVVGIGDAEQVYNSLNSAVQNFLGHRVDFLGMIPYDAQLPQAVREQVPLVHFAPDSPASRAIRLIAKQLHNQKRKNSGFAEVQSFWDTLSKN